MTLTLNGTQHQVTVGTRIVILGPSKRPFRCEIDHLNQGYVYACGMVFDACGQCVTVANTCQFISEVQ